MIGHDDVHVRLLDDARQAAAAEDRAARRMLREADEQDATFLGSLEELAETRQPVVVQTTVGRRLTGTFRSLAADHVVLDGSHGTAWVRIGAIAIVRSAQAGDVRAGGGGRPTRPAVALEEVLHGLVERRAVLEVFFDGGAIARGTAVAGGRDVVTLRDGTGRHVLVQLDHARVVTTTD